MQLIHPHPILDPTPLHPSLLHLQHRLIQVPLRCAKFPIHRERAGNVRGVVLVLTAGVDEEGLGGGEGGGVAGVVDGEAVGAAR